MPLPASLKGEVGRRPDGLRSSRYEAPWPLTDGRVTVRPAEEADAPASLDYKRRLECQASSHAPSTPSSSPAP